MKMMMMMMIMMMMMMMMMTTTTTTTNIRKINQQLKTRRIPSEHVLLLKSSRCHKKDKNTLSCYNAATQLYCCCFLLRWHKKLALLHSEA